MRYLLLFCLALAGCASQTKRIENPFFYQISKGSNRGVILGTVRTGVSAEELPSAVLTAFENADLYVMENRSGNFDINDRFARRGATQLLTLLTADEYAAMVTWLNTAYYQERVSSMLNSDTPVGVAEKLAYARMCNARFSNCRGFRYFQFMPLEQQLFQRRQTIDVKYLDTETTEEAARSCLSWSDDETRARILESLTGKEWLSGEVDRWAELEAAFRSGDSSRVSAAAAAYRTPAIYKCVITARNEEYASRIGDLMDRYRTPFFTVSVGHMEGPGSLADVLRRSGYRVERLEVETIKKAR